MPLYFFHLENGDRITGDEGEAFPNDEAALAEAESIAADLSRNQITPTGLRVIVTDPAGKSIGEVPLEVNRPPRGRPSFD